ncbi:hypothetical protein BRADI_3g57263v3 [Brachypodium distachyon]|uniref:Uncharacterized protein n=1 Tax=Brachypodium distachyon TaxID=15368 RepID=A0A2K2D5K2_BRADI|nr:hypothetical protein BRADI_3g57263v3 [Brachypodium distachyon]
MAPPGALQVSQVGRRVASSSSVEEGGGQRPCLKPAAWQPAVLFCLLLLRLSDRPALRKLINKGNCTAHSRGTVHTYVCPVQFRFKGKAVPMPHALPCPDEQRKADGKRRRQPEDHVYACAPSH